MDINSLHVEAQKGDCVKKNHLFQQLSVRFRTFVLLRIQDRQDAEEIVQEALTTVAREYDKVDFHTSFSAWAYTVLNYRMLSYFKTRKRTAARNSVPLEESEVELVSHTPDPTLRTRLKDCLGKVRRSNHQYARVLVLHYQGFTIKEICERLEAKRESLYMVLSRARAMLKSCLESGEQNR